MGSPVGDAVHSHAIVDGVGSIQSNGLAERDVNVGRIVIANGDARDLWVQRDGQGRNRARGAAETIVHHCIVGRSVGSKPGCKGVGASRGASNRNTVTVPLKSVTR